MRTVQEELDEWEQKMSMDRERVHEASSSSSTRSTEVPDGTVFDGYIRSPSALGAVFARTGSTSDGDSIYTAFSCIRDEGDLPVQHSAQELGKDANSSLWLSGSEGSLLLTRLVRDTRDRLAGSGRGTVQQKGSDRTLWETEDWQDGGCEDKTQFSRWRMGVYRWRRLVLQAINGVPARPLRM